MTDRLRRRHLATADRLLEGRAAHNLGVAFAVRLGEVRAGLTGPLDESAGLDLGVQAKGLRGMFATIDAQLSSESAGDVQAFVADVTDLAWMFPAYRRFVDLAEREGRGAPEGEAALVDAARVLEDLPDADIEPEMRSSIAAARINAEDGGGPKAWLGFRRVLGNAARAYARFLLARREGFGENVWKSFDKTGGGTVGAVLAVVVVVLPALAVLGAVFPAEFGFVVGLAKLAKLMIP